MIDAADFLKWCYIFNVTFSGNEGSDVAFSAYSSGAQNAVTGDGTAYTVQFDTQTGSSPSPDYDTGTSTFTAPISGYYQFSSGVSITGIDSDNTVAQLQLVATSGTYQFVTINPNTGGTSYTTQGAVTLFMNTGDTATVLLTVNGITKNINVAGASLPNIETFFGGGYLQPAPANAAENITITDDNSSSGTFYPVWVKSNSGDLPLFVSSTDMQFDPATSTFKILNSVGNYTAINAGIITLFNSSTFVPTYIDYQRVGSGSLFQAGILDSIRFGYDLYDAVTPQYVFYTDPYGEIGPSTAIHFAYSVIVDSTSPSRLLATDSNNIIVSAGSPGAIDITDDNSTNATMYPVWVTENSGNQPTFVSSTGFQWNPSTQTLKIGNDPFGDNIAISGDKLLWEAGADPVWDVGQLSISVFATPFGPPNWSVYDESNSTYVLIADTLGQLGAQLPTTFYFVYPNNSFPNSTSANKLMATDGNNFVTSAAYKMAQLVYVDNLDGNNSTADGSQYYPFKTYAAGAAFAVGQGASATNQYVLKMFGDFNEALTLFPFVHIDQEFSGTFTIVGNLSTDSSFNTTPNAVCNISNYSLTSSSPIDIIIATANNQVINFYNGSFGAIPNLSFEGASGAETIYIQDATTNGNFPSGVEVVNGILVLENVVVTGGADTSPTSTFNSTLEIINSYIAQTIFVDSTGSAGGNANLILQSSTINGWQLSGTLSFATLDSASYNSIPVLFGGALITQVTLSDLTDGILQTSYSPINYIPIGSSTYLASSLTAHIAGIDAQLSAITGSGTENIVWVGTNGVDSPGRGTFDLPFASASYAMSQITTNSASNPFTIQYGNGVYNDTGFAIKPFVSIDGNGAILICSSPITLDATWSSGGFAQFKNFFKSSFPSGINLDFSSATSLTYFELQNVSSGTADSFSFLGSSTVATQLIIDNVYGFGANPTVHIENCSGDINNSQPLSLYITQSDSKIREYSVNNCLVLNLINCGSTNGTLTLFLNNILVESSPTFSNAAPGKLTVINTGTFVSAPTLNGDSNLIFNTTAQENLPTIIGTPVVNYETISSTITADYSAVNYTPTNPQVSGHLAGIDAELGVLLGNSGTYTPSFTAVTAIGSFTLDRAFFITPFSGVTNIAMVTVRLTAIPSAQACEFTVSLPISNLFTANDQAILSSGDAIHTANVDDGTVFDAKSVIASNTVSIPCEVPIAGVGQTYTFNISFMYQIQ